LPIDLEKPESFLFAFADRGEVYAVRVTAMSHGAARAAFAAMTSAEKRARVVAPISARRERDYVAALGAWLRSRLGRFARGTA
jgi:hypothetical protein